MVLIEVRGHIDGFGIVWYFACSVVEEVMVVSCHIDGSCGGIEDILDVNVSGFDDDGCNGK